MNCLFWTKKVLSGLTVAAVLGGVAWGAPTGSANVAQILGGVTADPNGGERQRTFLTTDPITFNATYYDNNAACGGVAPTLVQLFLFNSEGVFIQQLNAQSDPMAFGPTYRSLYQLVAAGTLPADSYQFTFLVRDCTNTKSVVLPIFPTFRVIAP